MSSPPIGVVITDQAVATLKAQARATRINERGGILVGYRTDTALHIHDALVVPDHAAAHTKYVRRGQGGQRVLEDWFHATGDPTIGYVGEWHTHPAPMPPSPTDLAAARIMCIKNRHPVALVVASLEAANNEVTLHAVLTRPDNVVRRLTGSLAHVPLASAD